MEEEILFKIEIPSEAETIKNLESITKQSKALREERKKLNLETKEGQDRIKEINKQLDANTEIIKQNSSALEKQRLNIGNYTGALDKLVPGLGATINGFQGMAKAALSFIATPIGAVIGALGLAIGALTAYFKGSEEGQNNFNKIVKVGTVVLGNLLDIVRDFGGVIFKVFTGDFKGAVESLKEGFTGLKNIVSETNREISEGLDIENQRARADLLERELVLLKAKSEAEISSLKLRAEDKSLDLLTRKQALDEALRIQNELSSKEVELAKIRADIKTRENALSDSTKEDLNEEAELKARLFQIEKERDDKSKEIFTKAQALNAELEKELGLLERIQAARQLNFEEDAAAKQIQLDATIANNKAEIQSIANLGKAQFDSTALFKKLKREEQVIDQKLTESKIRNQQAVLDATSLALISASSLFKQTSIAYKAIAITLTIIDTVRGITRALSDYIFPYSLIVGALVGIAGTVQTAKIAGLQFAKGGLIVNRIAQEGMIIQGPSHAQGGVPFSVGGRVGFEAEGGEAIINKKSTAMFKDQLSAINVAGGGVPFAVGGITGTPLSVSQTARQSEANSANRDLAETISNLKLFVSVTDINEGQRQVQVIEDRATVIS